MIYPVTPCATSSSTLYPSSLIRFTERGCMIWRTSRAAIFSSMINRETFSPPAVEPPHAPSIVRQNISVRENSGQSSKFAVAKPVVDVIAAT